MFSKLIFRQGNISARLVADFQNRASSFVFLRCSGDHAPSKKMVLPPVVQTEEVTVAKQLENWDKANQIYFGPQRDLVNFPIVKQAENCPPTRLGFIPETWFQSLYEKTGVTGPYVFGISFTTFLLSKEIWIAEHNMSHFIMVWTWVALVNYKFGKKISAWFNKEGEKFEEKQWVKPIREAKAVSQKTVDEMEKIIWREEGQKHLFEAKRENVDLQLESIYRQRLAEVHQSVKKRLDYHVEVETLQKRVQQQHMVSWIVDNVVKSITPQQEKESLTKCISDLKSMASRAAAAPA